MVDALAWITSVLEMEIATIGTTVVTLGLLLAVGLIFGFAVGAFKRVRGRG